MSNVTMPRPRYVAFRIDDAAPLPRRAVADALRHAARRAGWAVGTEPQLTRYEAPYGIARVDHSQAAALRSLLAGMGLGAGRSGQESGAGIAARGRPLLPSGAQAHPAGPAPAVPGRWVPLSTSGTLRALTDRVGVLHSRGDPARP